MLTVEYSCARRICFEACPRSPLGFPFLGVRRSDNTDLKLTDNAVSRKHAELSWKDEAWVLTNFSQANPVRLNGQAITEPCELKGGEVLSFHGNHQIFEFTFSVQDDDATVVVRHPDRTGRKCV